MIEVFREYEEDGYIVREYSSDNGKSISHITREVPTGEIPDREPIEIPTLHEQIYLETRYQTALLELNTSGGNL